MIMLISRVFDGFSDVLMGTIIDRTHSKYGKARIWILRLAVPYALAAIVLFTMPGLGPIGKVVYAFVTYNIMNTVVYTAISQPFHALGSLMSRDRRQRDTICNIRMVLSITASMIITAFTLPLINIVADMIGNTQAAWITVTAVYAVISVFVLVNTYMTCTERVQTAQKSKEEDVPFWTALKAAPCEIMSTADCCRQTVSMSKSIRTGTRNIVSGTRAYTQISVTMRRRIRVSLCQDWSLHSTLTQRARSADAGWALSRTKDRRWRP